MTHSLRVLAAIGVLTMATTGCQKGAKSGAQGGREASGGAPAPKASEAPARAGTPRARVAGETASGPAVRRAGLTLTAPDNGTALDLRQGQVVTVVLPSNRSAGLSWTLAEPSGTAMVLDGKPVYAAAPTKGGGSGGTETWRFRAARSGEQAVRLEYGREWQRSVPERTFHFTATVR